MVWVYNGLIEQYADNYLTTTHGTQACTSCHGGNATATTRAAAHSGAWEPIPGSDKCGSVGATRPS